MSKNELKKKLNANSVAPKTKKVTKTVNKTNNKTKQNVSNKKNHYDKTIKKNLSTKPVNKTKKVKQVKQNPVEKKEIIVQNKIEPKKNNKIKNTKKIKSKKIVPKNNIKNKFELSNIKNKLKVNIKKIFKKIKITNNPTINKLLLKIKSVFNKLGNYIFNYKKIIILGILLFILLGIIIFLLRENPVKVLRIYKTYEVGDSIKINDTDWYVIEESDSSNSKVKLLSPTILDIDANGKIDDKDKVQFDKNSSSELNLTDQNNIEYLLNNTYKNLIKVDGISYVSLLTSKQYIQFRKKKLYGYTWKEGNVLASDNLGVYWLASSNNGKVYAVNTNGSFRLEESTNKYYVRPVITVFKTEIKK